MFSTALRTVSSAGFLDRRDTSGIIATCCDFVSSERERILLMSAERNDQKPPKAPARRPLSPRTRMRRRVRRILNGLTRLYPDAACALHFESPLQLLVATILSAQCTDRRVNTVTPALFARYPDAQALANAKQEELEQLIQSTGFFRSKA